MRPDATRDEGLRELGVHGRLRKIAYLPGGNPRAHSKRNQLLEKYKAELKKKKHALALELHPDVNLGEEAEVRAARSKKLQRALRAIDFVMTLNAQPPSGFGGFGGNARAVNPWSGIVR